MRSYTDEGIVLARKNYSEADRILSLYTKNHGRVAVLAKGVRRPTSKKRGHIEVFSHIKFQSVKGKGLDLITEVETIDNFVGIRRNLKKAAVAYYFMEAVGRTAHEGEKHEEVYQLLHDYLNLLKSERSLRPLRLDFIRRLLAVLGFWPEDKSLPNPDAVFESVIERQLSSARVGKRLFS